MPIPEGTSLTPKHLNPIVYFIGSTGMLLIVWTLFSAIPEQSALPSPITVMAFTLEEIANGQLPKHLGMTLYRTVACFLPAFILGMALGISMGRNRTVNSLLDFWLVLLLNVPALVVIILSYVFLGLTELAAVVAVIIHKTPNQTVLFREAARSFNVGYRRLAKVYQIPRRRVLTDIILPEMFPYIITACRSGLSLVWKIVLVVELLGRSNGVGFRLHYFFQLFYIEGILAYSLSFVLIVQAFEWGVLAPLERKAAKWRGT